MADVLYVLDACRHKTVKHLLLSVYFFIIKWSKLAFNEGISGDFSFIYTEYKYLLINYMHWARTKADTNKAENVEIKLKILIYRYKGSQKLITMVNLEFACLAYTNWDWRWIFLWCILHNGQLAIYFKSFFLGSSLLCLKIFHPPWKMR